MSDRRLYEMVKGLNPKCWHAGTYQGHDEGCFTVISYRPAKPCEHGNYAKHAVINASYDPDERSATKWDIQWCDGAALKDGT